MSLVATGLIGAAAAAMAVVLFLFERRAWSLRVAAIVATLAALGAAGRIPASLLPGLQPATFLVILAGAVMGPSAGMAAGMGVPLLSNFFLGHGPWTLWQMAAWGLCGAGASLWRGALLDSAGSVAGPSGQTQNGCSVDGSPAPNGAPATPGQPSRLAKRGAWLGLAAYGVVAAYAFGALMNFWVWLAYYQTHTGASWLAAWLLGVWPDTLHAFSNAFLLLAAGPPCARALSRALGPVAAQPPLSCR